MKELLEKPFVGALVISLLIVGVGYLLFGRGSSMPQDGVNMSKEEMESMMSDNPVAQSHRSYKFVATSNTSNIKSDQPTKIIFKVKNDLGETLKDFATIHEKIMHFIVVRRDLQEFQHLHPDYNQATGEFTLSVVFSSDGPYRLFPDFTPGKGADNPQLLPVTLWHDVAVGSLNNYKAQPVTADTSKKKTVSGYEIAYNIPSKLEAQSEISYTLTVSKNGQAVENLEAYLGALGHSVILKADTLDFIHAHAESGKKTGPDITFSTSFPEPGLYKTFIQFQHQGKVLTSDYIISVAPNTTNAPAVEQPHNGGH